MKRCALYVRVSTAEQRDHGISVDSQIEALKEFCAENEYQIAGIYNDAGISARKKYTKRPALLKLMSDCQAGEIDLILFTKLDRWFRSVADYYEVQTVLDQCHVPWRSIWEDYETETSSGVFKVNIMLSVAQSEADRTSERIKSVNEFKRARGDYVGKPPTGYMMQKKDMIKDPNQIEAVSAFFSEFLRTYSTRDAFKLAKQKGLKCSYETASRMLHNPAFKGDAFGGYKCDPYLTEEEYDQIQRIAPVVERKALPNTGRVYIFNGLTKCGDCGGIYSGTVRTLRWSGEAHQYKYYRCVSHQNLACGNNKSITEMKLERWLIDEVEESISIYNIECEAAPKESKGIADQIANLENRLKRIGDRYEDGDIGRDEYREKRDSIKKQIEELESQNDIKRPPIKLPVDWKEAYASLDDAHKKLFWRSFIKKIEIFKDGTMKIYF